MITWRSPLTPHTALHTATTFRTTLHRHCDNSGGSTQQAVHCEATAQKTAFTMVAHQRIKRMKIVNAIVFGISLLSLSFTGFASDGGYEQTISGWKSYQEVGEWLQKNFSFDKERQKYIQMRLKKQGPEGVPARNPATLFSDSKGYCADAANFARQALNKIDPAHNARWVYIKNARGKPNHWVTAFDYEGKLYIMDYGTGIKWKEMQGVHGPYQSLDEYKAFLASLSVPGFEAGEVKFFDFPGIED